MPDTTTGANADQVAYWNDSAGLRWATLQNDIDVMFAPLTNAAMALADARPGERVLDIGCGCGTTVLELSRRIGADGDVLGVDVSAPMLGRAAERLAGVANARLIHADASTHGFAADRNLVFSRFGVMFFDDPASAFAHIRTSLASGGRLVMAVWRAFADNAWAHVPFAIAAAHLPPQPAGDPHAPGPFAFADPDRVRSILTQAGFADIEITPHDTDIPLAGPGNVALAADRAMQVGPAARLVAEADEATRTAITAAIRADYARRETASGLSLPGGIWLVSAASGR